MLEDKRAQGPGERRTEILARPWVYSRVKVRQCRPREEIKTGKAKNTAVSLLAGAALPPSAPLAVREASQARRQEEERGNNPPHPQKLEGHNLGSLTLETEGTSSRAPTENPRKM